MYVGFKPGNAGTLLVVCFFWSPRNYTCVEDTWIPPRNLVASSTLSFVVSCIFNLSPWAVLCLQNCMSAQEWGFLGKPQWSGGVCSYMMQALALKWICSAPGESLLCSQCRVACCRARHVLVAADVLFSSGVVTRHSLALLGAMPFV